MNPYDPTERPGSHLVTETFGVTNPWMLTENYSSSDPRDLTGRAVAEAARNLDVLHDELRRAARTAIELLAPVEQGSPAGLPDRYGVLQEIGQRVEVLAARRGAAYAQLKGVVDTYRRVQAAPAPAQPSREAAQAPGRDDDWALDGQRQLRALEAVEAGGLRYCRTGFGDHYVGGVHPSDPAIWPTTIERCIADGLIVPDTSASLYDGQPLSLTDQGVAALRDSRATSSLVSAALRRTSTVTGSSPRAGAGPHTPSPPPAASKSPRSR
ncbi:hypothetical protein OG599_08950 [Streptomyces sp. NBC_01335]|uniref:hypothetical protein n=1 Tax=Streptomyces sp. NBC_01335 TaxID=2903828 RepID=UPI002E162F2E|nr:hypothetical protein OG599_08950 [Streptomyces sp. NBC_01335]